MSKENFEKNSVKTKTRKLKSNVIYDQPKQDNTFLNEFLEEEVYMEQQHL